MNGIVFDIKRGGVKDGPGIRTSVFLKGCPLRCAWCHNPESQQPQPETATDGTVCGREMSVDEVMAEVLPDVPFYATSGGGMTLTGGEPLAQPGFALALVQAAKAAGVHVALDTSGHAPWETIARFLPSVDLFLYDFKAADPRRHKELTGVDNALILANLERLDAAGARIFLRCPLVPGANDGARHLEAIAALAERLPSIKEVTLEPYHPLGIEKRKRFGKAFPSAQAAWSLDVAGFPSNATCAAWLAAVRSRTSKRTVLA
ncbi:MAG: glycyl-radical enzyme activating protein [Kiritimatiellae bacterium]|nr:glycyl-radical enzyme activating protein [Kiritimatiellia bacterium]